MELCIERRSTHCVIHVMGVTRDIFVDIRSNIRIFSATSNNDCTGKGLGVTVNANMEVSEQCRSATSQGNQILGMIQRNITYNRLDFRKYSSSQRTVDEWNKWLADCVHSSSVNMFKNIIDNYLVRA